MKVDSFSKNLQRAITDCPAIQKGRKFRGRVALNIQLVAIIKRQVYGQRNLSCLVPKTLHRQQYTLALHRLHAQ